MQHISTSTSDFTGALRGTKQIRAGDTIATINIDTSDDSIYETDEIFTLSITNVIGATPSNLEAGGSIIDNDPQPVIALLSFEQVASTATEGASFTYRLELDRASLADVSFDWSVQHISTSTSDFTGALRGTKQIRAGDTTTTISIDTSDDSIYETDEIFTLSITNVIGAIANNLVTSSAIIDNDPQPVIALLSFEQVASTAIEGASFTYRLELDRASLADVSFDWYVQHISTSTSDFRGALRGTKQIRAGDTTTTISIDTSDDSIYETDEIFTLSITNVIGATPSNLEAGGSIIDNDTQPSITFEQVASTATEGASFTYNLQLNRASLADVSFNWYVQHISTSTSDFTGALRGTKQIRAGDTTTTISIDTSDDSIYETDEIFTLNIINVTGAVPDSLLALGSILDNDTQPSITFAQVASTATEGASFTYNLQLNRASLADVSFDWSVQHISTSTSDFTGSLRGTKQIRAGDTTTTISIDTSDDSIYETGEIFTLNIINVIGAVPDSLFALGSILDNDPQPVITLLSFEQVASTAIEGASFTYNLQLNRASLADVSFDWSVQHISTSTSDFRGSLRGTKQIRAGDTTTTISIDTSDDSIYETDEIFTLNIINVTGAVPDSLLALGSILDNDTQPVIAFEQVASTATEGASFTYNLQLNRASLADVSFDWSLQHISTSTSDFMGSLRGTKQIRAGDTIATISIDTSDDSIYETDEIFTLSITNVIGAIPNNLATSSSIIDNDSQPVIVFEQVASTATEGTSFIYSLQLNKVIAVDVSFDWSLQHISTSTSDFRGVIAGRQQIRAGDTTVTIVLQINDDRRPEQAEEFTLNITNIRGATPDSLSRLITILENDIDTTADYNGNGLIDIVIQEQLGNIRYNLAGTSYKTSASDVGKTCGGSACRGYELLANLDLSAFTNWQPIGSQNNPFTSILQGNGYSIANLAISGSDYLGLFAALSGATIDNLVIEVVSIAGDSYVGTLAGRAEQSTISRVQIRAVDVNSKLQATGARVGGMLGETIGTTITNVISDLSIVGGNNDNADYVGGIVGYVASSTISYAYSSSSVSASDGADNVGGLVGLMQNNSAISYSSASSSVTSNGSDSWAYGGLVGRMKNNSTISYSSASGSVTSNGAENSLYGGLVGELINSTISDSSASGSVTSNGDGNDFYSGLVGRMKNNSTISYSSASGSVTSNGAENSLYGGLVGELINSTISDSSASGSVTSNGDDNDFYSGLVGRMKNNSTISYSSASGSVTSNGDDSDRYGGLVGLIISTSAISYSSASGSVSSSGDENQYYGGLAGVIQNNSAISYSSASGSVSSSGDENQYYGGLAGYMYNNSAISGSSASASVSSSGIDNNYYGGLAGVIQNNSAISYSSASGSVSSSGDENQYYGGLAGYMYNNSAISGSSASASVSSSGIDNNYYGGLAGYMYNNSAISDSSASASVSSSGNENQYYGGLAGYMDTSSEISDSSASGSVSSNGNENQYYGGLAGYMDTSSAISGSSASASVSSSGIDNNYYGGLAGYMYNNSAISYSSASASVSSSGTDNNHYGGLVGVIQNNSAISYSSASGNVISDGRMNGNYGGLAGYMGTSSAISYSSASGNVISDGRMNENYGGLVGESKGDVQHSWSSSSVFAGNPAGLVGNNTGNLKFSYALGDASYGLVATNTNTITNSYWNSKTSGALEAADATDNTINIASSDTASMLASTGSAGASVFADFADATDELSRKIWTFVNGHYPVIEEIGVDKQAVALAYGLLRLANPYVSNSTLGSFLGATLNNEDIELIANSYNADDALAILDVNLLQSNSAICAAGSGDIIMTTTGANGTTIALQKIAGSIEITKKAGNSCDIIFSNQKTDGTLQLAALISKGTASLSKKFEITLNTIQSRISLQPPTRSTREGDELVFTLELNHRARRDIIFDWSVQHSSTSTSDFTGATFSKLETISVGDTTTTIELQINDDDRPEQAETFTLNITNIRGIPHNNLSAFITILENDIDTTADYNGNGLIDIVIQEQLDNIRYNLAGTSYKTSASDAGKNCGGNICRGYELLGDLDLSVFANWQPIGSQNNPFTSILQGNGYSIANLAISGSNDLGLFATLSGATIDNLVVEVVSIAGDSYVGALAGRAEQSTISKVQIRAANTNSKLSATGEKVGGMLGETIGTTITNATSDLSIVGGNTEIADYVGGIVGYVSSSAISHVYSSGSVSASGGADNVGGLVGRAQDNSKISYSSTSGSVTSNGNSSKYYGGLVGYVSDSTIRYSSASGGVTSNGDENVFYGGLAGAIQNDSTISYSSASGNMNFNGDNGGNYGGLVGYVANNSKIRYSNAIGNVIGTGSVNRAEGGYGGLVGFSNGDISHSWSSSSVFASDAASGAAGLVNYNEEELEFSYALGAVFEGLSPIMSGSGLVSINDRRITNSYWNSETSGALTATKIGGIVTNIASSNTAGMLASTGFAGASVFADFADATDELNRNIWTFASGNYPVITELGVDEQAVSLAYGLLRLASPYAGVSNLDSFLGGTLNNENIELIANSYNTGSTLAILDVNLLQSNSATCAAGSGNIIMTTTGANGSTIALQKIAGSIEIEKSPSNSCDIIFSNSKTDGTLQLAAIISKGTASLSKKFEITLNTIQSRISLQPPTLSTSEGDELVFRLELNHRASRDVSFDWFVQHISTSTSDFTGAISGLKTILVEGTDATIMLQINDDDRPEQAENFTLNITNIRGVTHNNLSASITILENDLDITVDYNGNGLIDIVTQEHLDNIRYNLAGTSYKTSASDVGKTCGGNACSGYELLGNLDLSAFANWQPIGSQNDPFTNILQGNGYSIANLAIDRGNNIGLFAALSGATIDNLVVEVASISGDSYVGALAGRAEQSTISRVQIRAVAVNSKLQARGARAGGMLGETIGTTITNVISDLNIVGGGNNDDADYVGGIIGYVSSSDISYAYSSGSVSVIGSEPDNVGGLVGYMQNNSAISYSSASSSVTSNGSDSWAYGGLVGRMENNSTISYSSASGSVTSNGADNSLYGGLVGELINSTISDSSASGSVTSNGNDNDFYSGLVGRMENNSTISYSSASGSVTSNGDDSDRYGGLVGLIISTSDISHSSASGSVSSKGNRSDYYGALVGLIISTSDISYSSASGSVTSSGDNSDYYGGLVGWIYNSSVSYSSASGNVISDGEFSNSYGGLVGEAKETSKISNSSASGNVSSSGASSERYGGLVGELTNSTISGSSASGSVTSKGNSSNSYGGLAGVIQNNSAISYTSASGNVISNGINHTYGGLAGFMDNNSTISYSSASGNVISSGANGDDYGGLVGESFGEVQHSWSSSSVFASNPAGLAGNNTGNLKFSYALGDASYGLVATNTGTIKNSYWNSETSGALEAVDVTDNTINIASSDTTGMLASTGFAGASVFADFADATDKHNRNIWSFASGNYPVIAALGVDKQAVSLAYGLLGLAHPTLTSGVNSYLGSTLNHEAIALAADDYSANDTLAILDVNLLQSNSATCAAGSGDTIMTTTGANQAVVTLSINAENSNLLALIFNTDCSIDFDGAASISAGDRLQLAATITKGSASLTKNFVINFR